MEAIKRFFLVIVCSVQIGCTSKETEPMPNTNTIQTPVVKTVAGVSKKILALGDSYTIGESVEYSQRYPVQLVQRLSDSGFIFQQPKIIATTGWTTTNLINAITKDGDTSTYDLVFLLIGVNNQYQSKSIENYRSEFKSLLETSIQFARDTSEHVYVVSIPDYAYTPFGQRSNSTRISQEIDSFNLVNFEVTTSFTGVNYIDITPISRKGLEITNYVASDGLHPSGVQYGKWVDEILDVLFKKLSDKK